MTILFIVVFLLSNNAADDDRMVEWHRQCRQLTLDLRDTTGTLLSANNACWMEHGPGIGVGEICDCGTTLRRDNLFP